MKTVTSRDNPTLKALKALAGDARRQRETGQTLLDGPHLVTAALDRDIVPDLVAVSEGALDYPEVRALLVRLGGSETLCLPDALFRSISELAAPLGILARIAIPTISTIPTVPTNTACAVPPAPTFAGDCLLLDAVQEPGNVGTLLRTATAAGVGDVLLGHGCAGAWTPRVLRAAQGAHFGLRIHEQVDLAAFLTGYAGTTVAAVAHDGWSLYELDLTGPTAWLFGNEGAGIAADLVSLIRQRATIPLAPGCESLNVAAAAAICLFEMRRQRLSVKVGAGETV